MAIVLAVLALLLLTSCSSNSEDLPTNNSVPPENTTRQPSAQTSTITATPTNLIANGIDQATITIQLKDQNGDNLTVGGHNPNLTAEPNHGTISSITSNGNGTYTATFTAYGTGDITLTPTVDGVAFDNPLTLTREAKDGFYIDANEVTIRCNDAAKDDTATLKLPGKQETSYTKRTNKGDIDADNAASTCTSGIQNVSDAFRGSSDFNEDISHWDTSSVTNMSGMFYEANSFNQDINSWDTSKVFIMRDMFFKAESFNSDISGWDTSSVTEMLNMFKGAIAFNQDISKWNVSKVRDIGSMFQNATSFDQDLSGWTPGCTNNRSNIVANPSSDGFPFSKGSSFDGDTSKHPSWDSTCPT